MNHLIVTCGLVCVCLLVVVCGTECINMWKHLKFNIEYDM